MAIPLEQRPVRLIAKRGSGGREWSAFWDEEPDHACNGPTIADAVRRWLTLNRDRFCGPYAIQLDKQASTLDRRVMLLTATSDCPDCGGSGRYVGLTIVEDCNMCGGTGHVASQTTRF